MEFRSRAELEVMDYIALLWEQFYVAEAMLDLEKRITELKGDISVASAQLQEAKRRRNTIVFPFEDASRRENPILKGLRQNLFQKYEDVKNLENALAAIQEYSDLVNSFT
ncbi:uncharacterized protein A4U43_C03F31500 [Asparagus officinalis]|uniref:Uncharacterized protein n=1 Tax=Asparagus officinalis TaxID=4686 RepID=A0A5P1FEE0_ASPOF|nr:uncharacterized protein A4U43_C03F31500 [Asparagus officinalis]